MSAVSYSLQIAVREISIPGHKEQSGLRANLGLGSQTSSLSVIPI